MMEDQSIEKISITTDIKERDPYSFWKAPHEKEKKFKEY